MNTSLNRLGLYYNVYAFRWQSNYYLETHDYLLFTSLSSHCRRLHLLTRVKTIKEPSEVLNMDRVDRDIVDIIPLPYFSSYLGAILFIPIIIRRFALLSSLVDTILCRAPEPFSWVISLFADKYNIFFYFASNPAQIILHDTRLSFLSKRIKLWLYSVELNCILMSLSPANIRVNGDYLLEVLPPSLRHKARVVYESTLERKLIPQSSRHILSSSQISFLVVSRLEEGKGILELITAFYRLHLEDPSLEFRLRIVGRGTLSSTANKLIQQLALESRVELLGYVSNGPALNAFYESSDVFIINSRSEGLPRVLFEAMINSNLVISTNVGCIRKFIKPDTGLLLPDFSSTSLANSISWVFSNRDSARQMSQKGFRLARTFTLESFVESLL